jgi:hypothetical protein
MKWEIKNLGLIASCQASCLLSNFLLRNLANAGDMNHISKWLLHIKKYPRSQPNSAEGYISTISRYHFSSIYTHIYTQSTVLWIFNFVPKQSFTASGFNLVKIKFLNLSCIYYIIWLESFVEMKGKGNLLNPMWPFSPLPLWMYLLFKFLIERKRISC